MFTVKEYFIDDEEEYSDEILIKKFKSLSEARKWESKKIREFVAQNIENDVECYEYLKHFPDFKDYKKEVDKILKSENKVIVLYNKLRIGKKQLITHKVVIEME